MTAYTSGSGTAEKSWAISSGVAPRLKAPMTVSSVTRVPATRMTPLSSARMRGTGSDTAGRFMSMAP